MNRKEAKTTIINEFITNFNSTTPVCLENNENFYLCTTPLTPTTKPTSSPWIRFTIKNNVTYQKTFGKVGSRRWRRTGFIAAKVFIPENTGTYAGDNLCEEIISIFEGERLQDIVFEEGKYEEIGQTDEMWFLYSVIIYFSFDETK